MTTNPAAIAQVLMAADEQADALLDRADNDRTHGESERKELRREAAAIKAAVTAVASGSDAHDPVTSSR